MMEKAVKALRRITASRNRGAKEKTKNEAIDWDNLPELPEEFKQLRGACKVTEEDIAKQIRGRFSDLRTHGDRPLVI